MKGLRHFLGFAYPATAGSLMAVVPRAGTEQVVQVLKETAKHPGGPNRPDNRWGYGIIDPSAALAALKS